MVSAYVVWGLATLANLLIAAVLIHKHRWQQEVGLAVVQGVSLILACAQNYAYLTGDKLDLRWRGVDILSIFVSCSMAYLLTRHHRPMLAWYIGCGYIGLILVKLFEYALEAEPDMALANALFSYRRWFALILSYVFIACLYHGRIGKRL